LSKSVFSLGSAVGWKDKGHPIVGLQKRKFGALNSGQPIFVYRQKNFSDFKCHVTLAQGACLA
jgi:hypothetical protein